MATIEQKRAEQRERNIERKMRTCLHFTGMSNECCAAGIRYDTFANGLPCIIPEERCEKREFKTREEAEAAQVESDRRSALSLLAMHAAHADAKVKGFGKGHAGASSIKCPVCEEGELFYRVASVNGHMHAGCRTKGCVSWME